MRNSEARDAADPRRRRSLAAILWDWFTVEVPEEPPPVRRVRRQTPRGTAAATASAPPPVAPAAAVSKPLPAAPQPVRKPPPVSAPTVPVRAPAPRPGRTPARRASAPAAVSPRTARRLRRRAGELARAWRHTLAGAGLAAAGVGTVVLASAIFHHPGPPTAAAATPPPTTLQAATSSTVHATSTSTAAPDCASMKMQPLLASGSAHSQPVPGLCFSLGPGFSWHVGCAPGYQTQCDPWLHPVLSCVDSVGAAKHTPVTESNIRACVATGTGAAAKAGAG